MQFNDRKTRSFSVPATLSPEARRLRSLNIAARNTSTGGLAAGGARCVPTVFTVLHRGAHNQ